jgi:hypothetical protein
MDKEDYQYTGIQYMGCVGSTDSCKRAVIELIQFGREVQQALLLTYNKQHCFLLKVDCGDYCLIRAGFTSGYRGGGPAGLAYVLSLLNAHKIPILEIRIEKDLFERANNSLLTNDDIKAIEGMKPVRPESKWFDYIYDMEEVLPSVSWEEGFSEIELTENTKTRDKASESSVSKPGEYSELWREFPSIIPYALIDDRIADLALEFSSTPDKCLLDGYRRLEGLLRQRTGLDDDIGKKALHNFASTRSRILRNRYS